VGPWHTLLETRLLDLLVMLILDVPGWKELRLEHLFLDYNGTLALDGRVLPGVAERLQKLASAVSIHVLTADTFGSVHAELADFGVDVLIVPPSNQAEAKAGHLGRFGASISAAIGNGRNDALMLRDAALGIAVLQTEGACAQTLTAADVVCTSIGDALDLLLHPLRLAATMRD
jgi:soluble P-type ATPase